MTAAASDDPSTSSAAVSPETVRRPAMVLIFSITVVGVLGNTLLPPALPRIIDALDVAEWQAGLILTAGVVPGIVCAPIIGVLADRFGRRAVVVPCLAIFGAFGAAGGFAPSFGWLLALRVGQGVGAAGLVNLSLVLIADHWSGEERARRIGWNIAVLTTTIAIVPPIGGLISETFGWRAIFAVYSVGLVVAALLWFRLPVDGPRNLEPIRAQITGLLAVARRPEVLAVVWRGTAVFVLIFGVLLTVLPLRLERAFGSSDSEIGLILGSAALGSGAVALSVGWLRARLGPTGLLRAGIAAFALGFAGLAVAPSPWWVVAAVLLYGAGEGAVIPQLQNWAAEVAPPDQRGVVIAVWVGFVRLGQALGPVIGGLLLAGVGTQAAFAVAAAGAVALGIASRNAVPGQRN